MEVEIKEGVWGAQLYSLLETNDLFDLVFYIDFFQPTARNAPVSRFLFRPASSIC